MASTAFGTMGEDANLNVVKSLTTLGEDFTDVKGKMEEVKNVKYDTVASSLETIKRGLTVNVVEPIAGPVLSSLLQARTVVSETYSGNRHLARIGRNSDASV